VADPGGFDPQHEGEGELLPVVQHCSRLMGNGKARRSSARKARLEPWCTRR
jgi:hypothetical protein